MHIIDYVVFFTSEFQYTRMEQIGWGFFEIRAVEEMISNFSSVVDSEQTTTALDK